MMRHWCLILLLLTVILPGCQRDPLPGKDDLAREMGIYIMCPGEPATRADLGDLPAKKEEYSVHTLQVWVFNHNTKALLYHLSLSGDQLPTPGHTRRYAIPVDSEFARTNPLPTIDVFALANAASVGCGLDKDSNWATVNNTLFTGDDYFGVGEDKIVTSVPDTGLPMTGVRRDMTLSPSEDGIILNADQTVEIVRAVSKIRYVFCRLWDEGGSNSDFSIHDITLNGGQIPISEYLFTEDKAFRIGNQYETRSIETPGPTTIAHNQSPEKLVYAGQSAAAYEKLLEDAIEDGILTDGGTMYLRESDKALTGVINFTTEEGPRSRVFSMATPGDFVRNHNWILYGYFINGRKLELSINAIPWDYSHYHIDFATDVVVHAERFLVYENSVAKIKNNTDGHKDVFFKTGVAVKGYFIITSPLHASVLIRPEGEAGAFLVSPERATIDPDVDGGRIEVTIRPNPDFPAGDTEYSMTLSFYVETPDGREINVDDQIELEHYRFCR